jgi:hypothetical protein
MCTATTTSDVSEPCLVARAVSFHAQRDRRVTAEDAVYDSSSSSAFSDDEGEVYSSEDNTGPQDGDEDRGDGDRLRARSVESPYGTSRSIRIAAEGEDFFSLSTSYHCGPCDLHEQTEGLLRQQRRAVEHADDQMEEPPQEEPWMAPLDGPIDFATLRFPSMRDEREVSGLVPPAIAALGV